MRWLHYMHNKSASLCTIIFSINSTSANTWYHLHKISVKVAPYQMVAKSPMRFVDDEILCSMVNLLFRRCISAECGAGS